MRTDDNEGWKKLVEGHPWFEGKGHYPLPAYSEFMPPPRLGQTAYGEIDRLLFSEDDPYGWRVSELEEAYEIRPGIQDIAAHVLDQLTELGQRGSAPRIGGKDDRNLKDNPYWPKELHDHAGKFAQERYLLLLPLALSKTQDDMGRVRWTFFGSSEQGPERAFWRGFYTAPGQEIPERESNAFILELLNRAFNEQAADAGTLHSLGFRILPSLPDSRFPYWHTDPLPAWTRPYLIDDGATFDKIRYLLTFRPFGALPAAAKAKYLAGELALLPFPGSLAFWGMPSYLKLQAELPMALQPPLQRVVPRHGGPDGLRVPQSGWMDERNENREQAASKADIVLNTYRRTSRWDRSGRDQDEVAASVRMDNITRVLFSTDLDALGLYDKPEARNCQVWSEDTRLLLDGPRAGRAEIKNALQEIMRGDPYRYRFQFPAMRVGPFEVYWQRPLVAFIPPGTDQPQVVLDAPKGYLTAYRAESPDLAHPVELYPRLLRRAPVLAAIALPDEHEHYRHQVPLNLITLLDSRQNWDGPLPPAFAKQMLRRAEDVSLDELLALLPQDIGEAMRSVVDTADPKLPGAITYEQTATRAFEVAFWNDIKLLSEGGYRNKDNADRVDDPATTALAGPRRDLERLGVYLLKRHQEAIAQAGMEGKALCGEIPFQWKTDFEYSHFGGWNENQSDQERERDLLVVIPGRNRGEAVVLADHYDTAYEEDTYDRSRGGSGARLAAPGADDNCSATATLLQAAPIFLQLAREGKLERDVWLLHLTGEEFPADCLGARHICQALVEKTLTLHAAGASTHDLSAVRVVGVFVMDMIAHNRDSDRNDFQVSPGRGAASLKLAWQAHMANQIWNERAAKGNSSPERKGKGKGRRSPDGATIPETALFPVLDGQVRTVENPQSSLYNTDGQIFSDTGVPVVLLMENYDLNRSGYHDTKDTMQNIDLDYGAALSAIAIETVARVAGATK